MPDYNLLGSQEVLEELQEGRTRELLLLLQDKPVPEVNDPLNLQSGLSTSIQQTGSDYQIKDLKTSSPTLPSSFEDFGAYPNDGGVEFQATSNFATLEFTVDPNVTGATRAKLQNSGRGNIATQPITPGNTYEFSYSFSGGSNYYLVIDAEGSDYTSRRTTSDAPYPLTSTFFDIVSGVNSFNGSGGVGRYYNFSDVVAKTASETSGNVTDSFSAPTTAPADFKSWNAIRAEDVTTGGSTSPEPVEFDILDASDTIINTSRIPPSEIADSNFNLRGREYATTAGSDGQADYQIPVTGSGGNYGIPILSVVTVKQNGSVLDPSDYEFDGADTVTIDTASVSVESGDSFTISYDLDVFDSTLQPRAYLSRESTDETSPSISHFRYEYVI